MASNFTALELFEEAGYMDGIAYLASWGAIFTWCTPAVPISYFSLEPGGVKKGHFWEKIPFIFGKLRLVRGVRTPIAPISGAALVDAPK